MTGGGKGRSMRDKVRAYNQAGRDKAWMDHLEERRQKKAKRAAKKQARKDKRM